MRSSIFVWLTAIALLLLAGVDRVAAQTPPSSSALQENVSPAVNNSLLDGRTLYHLILANLHFLRKDTSAALQDLSLAARSSKDETLFREATQIAIQGKALHHAKSSIKAWIKAYPSSEQAAGFALSLLSQGEGGLETDIESFLHRNPSSKLRQSYIVRLLSLGRTHEALDHARRLRDDTPQSGQAWLLLASVHQQRKAWNDAQQNCQKALDIANQESLAPPSPSTLRHLALLCLAQTAWEQKQTAAMNAWLEELMQDKSVASSEQTHLVSLLGKSGQIARAEQFIQNLKDRNTLSTQDSLSLRLLLYRQAQDWMRAWAMLADYNARNPGTTNIKWLYEQGIVAQELQRYEEAEQIFRKILAQDPFNAVALNALGYSLADRNERLAEARVLLEKAAQTAPQSAHIIDSMGWLEYRHRNFKTAITYLQKAYAMDADPEIGAHLGEVLWVSGKKQQALKIWRMSWQAHPDHPVLRKALQRLSVNTISWGP